MTWGQKGIDKVLREVIVNKLPHFRGDTWRYSWHLGGHLAVTRRICSGVGYPKLPELGDRHNRRRMTPPSRRGSGFRQRLP